MMGEPLTADQIEELRRAVGFDTSAEVDDVLLDYAALLRDLEAGKAILIRKDSEGKWPSHVVVRLGDTLFERMGYIGIPNLALYEDVSAALDALAGTQPEEGG